MTRRDDPDYGDIVALIDKDGNAFIEAFCGYGAYERETRFIVLMRAEDARMIIDHTKAKHDNP
jgi:hypothetical protein